MHLIYIHECIFTTTSNKKTYWRKRQIRPQSSTLFIHYTYFIGQSMKVFRQFYYHIEACLLHILQFCFLARSCLVLCDFYLKMKKKQLGITRLIIVLCLCPSIIAECKILITYLGGSIDLGEADMSHSADLSHVCNIGWKVLWWPASLSHIR
jgi:hypothetical protein